MNWLEIKITINQEAADALINLLSENNAGGGVITEDIVDNSNMRQQITAYYPDTGNSEQIIADLKERIMDLAGFGLDTGVVDLNTADIANKNWNESWLKYFKAQEFGDNFMVCPIQEECLDRGKMIIKLEPGQAFGTGGHITSRLAVKLLEMYTAKHRITNMLDMGTGTGILAIAAAKLGVEKIEGIDRNWAAVKVAKKNIKINRVEKNIKIKQGNLFNKVEGRFSLIVANLLPNIILEIIPYLPEFTNDKGYTILSGINETHKSKIINLLQENNFIIEEQLKKEDWTALAARKG